MQMGKIQAIHLHKNWLRVSQMHYIPEVTFLPSLVHLYSCTKSRWEENSCFVGHCSQKNKCCERNDHKTVFPDSAPISVSSSQEVQKFSKAAFSVFHKKLLFSCPIFTPTVYTKVRGHSWCPLKAQGPILRLHNPEPKLHLLNLLDSRLTKLLKLLHKKQGLIWVLGINLRGWPQCHPFPQVLVTFSFCKWNFA